MPTRRTFIKNSSLCTAGLGLSGLPAFASLLPTAMPMPTPMISLAQWSLHRSLEAGTLNAENFAPIAVNDYGIRAVEYVNSFYKEQAAREPFWNSMRTRAENEGVKSLLMMVDGEGNMGDPDDGLRREAVENHYKWVHAIKLLGGHSIRVNAFGPGGRASLKQALADGLGRLSEYAARDGIQVLIENHGLHTSDARFIIEIIREVDNPNLGTLPDFGNWCLSSEWGSTQDGQCQEMYDPLKGVQSFLPYARGVSAKSYAFDAAGYETLIDYPALLGLVKASGYDGYIGIEYEGLGLSEPEGIRATKKLIEKVWSTLE